MRHIAMAIGLTTYLLDRNAEAPPCTEETASCDDREALEPARIGRA